MVTIESIRKRAYVDGWSIRRISREMGISRQAVRKALLSSAQPQYTRKKPPRCPVMDPFREIISGWMETDKTAPPKQRHTAHRIYTRLVEEYGFAGGESTVRRYVRLHREKDREAFLPLSADWGQQAQVDWFSAAAVIAGMRVPIHVFVMRMRASRVVFAWASPTEKLEAFLEGHIRAFRWFRGVPRECVYDNPKTAVVRILKGPERDEHFRFSSLRAHYLFDSQFCGAAQPQEKGSVENVAGYVRRNALVPVPEVASWQELNGRLLDWCEKNRGRLRELWAKESRALMPLPEFPFSSATTKPAVASKVSLVTVDRNRYSVPCEYAGRTLLAHAFTHEIQITHQGIVVAAHSRLFGRSNPPSFKLEHYLPALKRKPRAAAHLAVVAQMPEVYSQTRSILLAASKDGYKEFGAILMLHAEFPADDVTTALETVLEKGPPTAEAVRQVILNNRCVDIPQVDVPDPLAQVKPQPANLGCYDELLRRRTGNA